MRLYSGKMIGQSSPELLLAVFFSFFLHAALVALALIIVMATAPKVHIPLSYEVKLVGQPQELAPPSPPAPSPPKAESTPIEKKSQPKVKIAPPKPAPAAPKKGDMPELAPPKPKQARSEEAKPAKPEQEQAKSALKEHASAPNVAATAPVKGGSKTEEVEVKSGDPKIAAYESSIKGKIERYWKYPEGSKGREVTVSFKVNRTGQVVEVKISDSNADEWFKRAAEGAIWASSPVPMPVDYYKDAVFTVVLKSKE